ncbi:hypothetical protein BCR37DRAFT_99610 [Protomyces lactucae-debilis]|uniref:Uncharacterized protein n=1 Tax=Protomyces lactucae-debilis TaxID=2754530 RepID=A0A1Y2F510_PROLT|nr:uncharacterized protein BCR37DRAFT_99610 [Protomyces lactucae-debilis]ORY78962.1 hypothetical protein BCR37DRAFT_99610 [Protomyces lactucae-debilis]
MGLPPHGSTHIIALTAVGLHCQGRGLSNGLPPVLPQCNLQRQEAATVLHYHCVARLDQRFEDTISAPFVVGPLQNSVSIALVLDAVTANNLKRPEEIAMFSLRLVTVEEELTETVLQLDSSTIFSPAGCSSRL